MKMYISTGNRPGIAGNYSIISFSPPFVSLFMDDFYIFLSSIIHITCPKKRTSTGFFTKSVTVHTHASKWMFLCISPKFIFSFCPLSSLKFSYPHLCPSSLFFHCRALPFVLFFSIQKSLFLSPYNLSTRHSDGSYFSRIRFFPCFPVSSSHKKQGDRCSISPRH